MNFKKLQLLTLFFIIGFISCNDDEVSILIEEEIDNPELEIDFVKTYGGSNLDEAVAVVEANDGGYVILGTTSSTDGDVSDKTSNDADYWLLKVDADGEIQWNKTYGGSLEDRARGLDKTLDGGYIISGQSRSSDGDVTNNEGFFDFWIVKVGSQGGIEWEKNYGFAGSDQAYDIFQTLDGGYFVTGILDVTASNGEGNSGRAAGQHAGGDYWTLKLDAFGELEWSRYFGGSFTDTAHDALQTDNGDFIIIGFSDSDDVDITDNKGAYDFWIVRVSPTGDLIWQKNFGGSEIDVPYSITATEDGNYIVVGDTRSTDFDVSNPIGNADLWAVKFNDNGDIVWDSSYGGLQFESARGIDLMSNGNCVITGSTRSISGDVTENNGQNDIWTLIISPSGAIQAQQNIGGTGLDFGEAVMQTSDNKIIIVGNTESTDVDIPENKGIKDIILVKMN